MLSVGKLLRFQVFMAVMILIMSFWVKVRCGLVGRNKS
jgi:hypothetical protein